MRAYPDSQLCRLAWVDVIMSLAAWKGRRRGRRHNATGRSTTGPRFVKLEHWILKTPAWQSLPSASRALYVELAQRYNGYNNGEISMSVREAARLLHIAKDTATKAFHELEEKGFIRRNVCGSFNWKIRHATTWILTEHSFGDKLPSKEFARWSPENHEPGPNIRTRCPKSGTTAERFQADWPLIVSRLGPWAPCSTIVRSQIAARI